MLVAPKHSLKLAYLAPCATAFSRAGMHCKRRPIRYEQRRTTISLTVTWLYSVVCLGPPVTVTEQQAIDNMSAAV